MDLNTLYDAAIAGDADAIAKLELKADRPDKDRRTILHTESINGNTDRVRFILKQFAHKNLLVELENQQKTALTWAAYYGRTQVAEVLIDAARHLQYSSSASDNPFTSLQAFLRHADSWLNTALHLAAEMGHASVVKLLVEADSSDAHLQNLVGKTPLYLAAEEGYNDIVEIICTTCTAPSLDGPRGSTALHAALQAALKNVHKGMEYLI